MGICRLWPYPLIKLRSCPNKMRTLENRRLGEQFPRLSPERSKGSLKKEIFHRCKFTNKIISFYFISVRLSQGNG